MNTAGILLLLLFSINSWALSPAQVVHPVTGVMINTTQLETREAPPLPEASGLKFYIACHEALEIKLLAENQTHDLCLNPIPLPEIQSIQQISSELALETFERFKAREKHPEYQIFLRECHITQSKFHRDIARLTMESYDISFLNREAPQLENDRNGAMPEGYKIEKYYGHNPEACYQTGLKAALFIPDEGDHVVFAITGTEGSDTYRSGKKRETYLSVKPSAFGLIGHSKPVGSEISAKEKDKEDWTPIVGARQFRSECGQQMMADAIEYATKHNKRIVFTGHSLGGAISQAMGYEVQRRLMLQNPAARPVEVVSFMSAGGRGLVRKSERQVEQRLNSVMYASRVDIVSVTGAHVAEIREMVRTDEYEQEFRTLKKPVLETHTLEMSGFKDLGESQHMTEKELGLSFNNYVQSFYKPKE